MIPEMNIVPVKKKPTCDCFKNLNESICKNIEFNSHVSFTCEIIKCVCVEMTRNNFKQTMYFDFQYCPFCGEKLKED